MLNVEYSGFESIESLDLITKKLNEIWKDYNLDNITFMSITLTNDEQIQLLNNEYRQKNKTTDVLSFEFNQDLRNNIDQISEDEILTLGDIFLSKEYVIKQAKELDNLFEEELMFLIIHGMLHLLGYDHEISQEEEKIMLEIQKKYFKDYHVRNI